MVGKKKKKKNYTKKNKRSHKIEYTIQMEEINPKSKKKKISIHKYQKRKIYL